MKRDVLYRSVLVVCLAALAAVAFAGCGKTPTATPLAAPTAVKPAVTATPPAAPAYIPGYLIATGNPAAMTAAVDGFNAKPPVALGSTKLFSVETLPLPESGGCQAVTLCLRTGSEMRLYRLTHDGTPVVANADDTAAVINWFYDNYQAKGACVYVDPVYRTGAPPPNLLGGDPWIAGGSPWIAGGSPWIAGGSGGDTPEATVTGFQSQWALGGRAGNTIGVSLTAANGTRLSTYGGKGVRIGVFDTSPLAATKVITWAGPAFSLNVVSMQGAAGPATTSAAQPGMSEHGLFVAGLAHAVAPDSEIRLYPVLDANAQGDLWTLARSMLHFTRGVSTERGNLYGAVMNLSLGLHPQTGAGGLPKDVMAVATLVSAAHCQGIVVVAAAGNDSAGGAAKPAQLPASLPEAIAVAASDMAGNRACYSNHGEIMAPGGEATDGCAGQFGMPSMISLVTPSQAAQSGYAYWAGTSFATPLVSGLAALVAERQYRADPGLWAGQPMTFSNNVASAIVSGASPSPDASAGMKIIDVEKTAP